MLKYFRSKNAGADIPLPIFFPDATRAVVRAVDSTDLHKTKTPGILVNTYHLLNELGEAPLKLHKGIGPFMGWRGAVISDSGGFQVLSLVKASGRKGKVTDEGVTFSSSKKKKVLLTPEMSISYQFSLGSDLMVVLDDFTPPGATRKQSEITVNRTIEWAKRSKEQFEKECSKRKIGVSQRPYLIAVVQGGDHLDLRSFCAEKLVESGFDGLGYGGWPIDKKGNFNYEVAKIVSDIAPKDYILYGLGIGKPDDIAGCFKLGFEIFDCVLPTRDARHGRLYVYNFDSINDIKISGDFYSLLYPRKQAYLTDNEPVSRACDCTLCRNYSRSYLSHLFRIKDMAALRLATIHNLRFYSLLMEKLGQQKVDNKGNDKLP